MFVKISFFDKEKRQLNLRNTVIQTIKKKKIERKEKFNNQMKKKRNY